MSQVQESTLLGQMLDDLSRCLDAESARRVIELKLRPSVHDRIEVLAEKANEGSLTPDERNEYEAYINFGDILSALKIKAKRSLGTNGVS